MVKKNKAAAALGKKGGKSGTGKAKARTPEQARAAASARWAKQKPTCHKCGYGLCEPFDKCTDCGGLGILASAQNNPHSSCCEEWTEHTTYKVGGADMDEMADGTWSVSDSQSYVLDGIKFCPWCGKQTTGKPNDETKRTRHGTGKTA